MINLTLNKLLNICNTRYILIPLSTLLTLLITFFLTFYDVNHMLIHSHYSLQFYVIVDYKQLQKKTRNNRLIYEFFNITICQ